MDASYPLPFREEVRDLLMDLLGRKVLVEKIEPWMLAWAELGAIAEYIDDEDRLAAVCLLDGEIACHAGAALAMVPAQVATESLKKNEVADNLSENTREIVNVLAALLNSDETPHVRLRQMYLVPGDVPSPVMSLASTPATRRFFKATIDGYGAGKIALMSA